MNFGLLLALEIWAATLNAPEPTPEWIEHCNPQDPADIVQCQDPNEVDE
jgi:hypothetical protein